MSAPTKFGDYGKSARDILKKFFPTGGNSFTTEWDLKAVNSLSSKGKIVNNDKGSFAEATDVVTVEGIKFEGTFKTEKPSLDITISPVEQLADGLDAKLLVQASDRSQYVGFSLGYKNENANTNLKALVPVSTSFINFVNAEEIKAQDFKVDFDVSLGASDYNQFIGASTKVTIQKAGGYSLEEAAVTLGWNEDAYKGTVGYVQKIDRKDEDKVKKSVVANLSVVDNEITYAAALDYSVERKNASVQFGFEKNLDANTTYKLKFDTNKQAAVALVSKLSESTTLNFGTVVNVNTEEGFNVGTGISVGLKVKN